MNKEKLIIGFFEKGYCCDLDEVKDTCLGLLKENQELKRQNEFLMKRDNKCQRLEQQAKEFIKWLENGIEKVKNTEFLDERIQRAGLIAYNRCLRKYKKIVNGTERN